MRKTHESCQAETIEVHKLCIPIQFTLNVVFPRITCSPFYWYLLHVHVHLALCIVGRNIYYQTLCKTPAAKFNNTRPPITALENLLNSKSDTAPDFVGLALGSAVAEVPRLPSVVDAAITPVVL